MTVVGPNHSLVALLARHKLSDHCRVLGVNGRLVGIGTPDGLRLHDLVLRTTADVRKLNVTMEVPMVTVIHVVPTTRFALHVVVAMARVHLRISMVDLATLRHMALSLLLIIVDAVDIHDSIVFLARMTLNLDDAVGSSLNLGLTATSTIQEYLLFVRQLTGVLGDLVLRRRVVELARVMDRRRGSMVIKCTLADALTLAPFRHTLYLLLLF